MGTNVGPRPGDHHTSHPPNRTGQTRALGLSLRTAQRDHPSAGPILVTIVGDEPLAPLVLARQLEARQVICLAQPIVEWRIEPLLDVLRRDGRTAEAHTFTSLDVPAGLRSLKSWVPPTPAEGIVFDLTNARSVLGFALYDLAHQRELAAPDRCRVLRIDWSERVIRPISPDRAEGTPLQATLNLADYLAVHGKILLGYERRPDSRSPFGQAAHRLARAIPQARPLIDATHRGAFERPLRLRNRPATTRLLDDLIADGVLTWRGSDLFATSPRAFQFLHGRWLEEYLFEIADASGQFDDCASGLRFRWTLDSEDSLPGPGEVANEIDFAGTANGRATIASCKTGGHDVNGPLYELLTLAERAAGRSVIPVFATTDTLDRVARRRAAALGVRILDATRLPDPNAVLGALLDGTAATPAPTHVRHTRGANPGRGAVGSLPLSPGC